MPLKPLVRTNCDSEGIGEGIWLSKQENSRAHYERVAGRSLYRRRFMIRAKFYSTFCRVVILISSNYSSIAADETIIEPSTKTWAIASFDLCKSTISNWPFVAIHSYNLIYVLDITHCFKGTKDSVQFFFERILFTRKWLEAKIVGTRVQKFFLPVVG